MTVKTQKGNFNRSIQKLHLLEGHIDPENHEIVQTKAYVPERATKTKPTGVRYVNVVRQGGENVGKPQRKSQRESTRLRRPPERFVP